MDKLIKTLKNKYTMASVVFLALALFIDPALKNYFDLKAENKTIRKEIEYYEAKIKIAQEETKALKTNSYSLEKYARETFYMKRKNEEIFIVEK